MVLFDNYDIVLTRNPLNDDLYELMVANPSHLVTAIVSPLARSMTTDALMEEFSSTAAVYNSTR